MKIPKLVFEIVRKNKIMMPHLLKEYLGVGCVTSIDRIINIEQASKGFSLDQCAHSYDKTMLGN